MRSSKELFSSPIAYGSKLGKYTGTINRQTALERQGYAMTTRFDNAIKEKKGLIAFIQRRELLRGNSGYYQAQIQNLQEKIKELEASRDAVMKRLDAQNELITNNAGKMVPAAIFGPAGIPSNTPVAPPGIVGPAPEQTPLPDETPEGSATTEEPSGSDETSSVSTESYMLAGQSIAYTYLYFQDPSQDLDALAQKVGAMSQEELEAIADLAQKSDFEPQVENISAEIKQKEPQTYEELVKDLNILLTSR
jgi:hypothetical protein